jgi:hypothetical protein
MPKVKFNVGDLVWWEHGLNRKPSCLPGIVINATESDNGGEWNTVFFWVLDEQKTFNIYVEYLKSSAELL